MRKIPIAEAKNLFRSLWLTWCWATTYERHLLEHEMNTLEVMFGEDPVWDSFVGTLPGFTEVFNERLGLVLDLMERTIDQD